MPRGSCACGAYTYEVATNPDATVVCHCLPCRKFAGINGSTNAMIETDKYKILSGKTSTFTRKGESGKDVTNHSCDKCSTLMRVEAEAMPGMLIYKPGTLDDAKLTEAKPVAEIFTRNRPDCFAALKEVPQNDGAAPS